MGAGPAGVAGQKGQERVLPRGQFDGLSVHAPFVVHEIEVQGTDRQLSGSVGVVVTR